MTQKPGIYLAGLHDHCNRGRFSIQAFSGQSDLIKKLSKNGKKDWLEKILDRKSALIEVIM